MGFSQDFEGDDFEGFERMAKPGKGKGGQRPKLDKEGIRQLGEQSEIIVDKSLTYGLIENVVLKIGPRGQDSANRFYSEREVLAFTLDQLKAELTGHFRGMPDSQRNGIFDSQGEQAEVVRSALKIVGITGPKLARDPR